MVVRQPTARGPTPGNPQSTWRAPISCRSSLTCGNKSKPVADVLDDVANDDAPEQRALDSEASRQMNELLSTLPEKHREILILRLVVGMSAEETAAAVGSSGSCPRGSTRAFAGDEGR
ncbi:hypothetical protein OPAG_03665 [Rhodococcus opacus PD630]|nr:hypothetical protein OPAG_03665 [Rhodococcus opacus PD630]